MSTNRFGKLPLEKRMGLTPTTFEWEGYYAMQIGTCIKYYLVLGPLFWEFTPTLGIYLAHKVGLCYLILNTPTNAPFIRNLK
jgi:hypothetical protein